MAKKIKKPAVKRELWFPLCFCLLLFLLSLLYFLLPKNNFDQARQQILVNPLNYSAHLNLAEELLKNHELNKAEKELEFLKQKEEKLYSSKNSLVLGSTSRLDDLWTNWQEQNPSEIQKLIDKWEKIVAETPNYRDGYLYLSLYYFKLGNRQKAQENLEKALDLDPNYPPAWELKNLISK